MKQGLKHIQAKLGPSHICINEQAVQDKAVVVHKTLAVGRTRMVSLNFVAAGFFCG